MGAKGPLNGTSKVNTQTDGQTDGLIENIAPEGRCFEKSEKRGAAREKTGTTWDKKGTIRDKTETARDKKGQGHNWKNP